ncbi:uncharacterized protein LOC132642838 [Lycium barbarum]|uniref:uncharacterized protein LOC132642838 n=1 Tax=Lycium barbarum TaxID=112863 RepID=UPI00293E4D3B|nr:uncharacterized protein LOC132642838 [Lycium barbarum]
MLPFPKLCFILFLGFFFLPILVPALIVISMTLILLFPAWSVCMFGLILPEITYKCPKKITHSIEGSEESQISLELDPSEFPFDLSESEEDESGTDETYIVCIDQESSRMTTFPKIRGQKSFDALMSFWRRQVEEK